MSIIYVVTSGCYSDYGIEAVFDSRDKAVAYIGGEPTGDRRIEEYALNDGADERQQGLTFYEVTMDLNGNVTRIHARQKDFGELTDYRDGYIGRPAYSRNPPWFRADAWARDEHHAIKIANEKRIVALANENR